MLRASDLPNLATAIDCIFQSTPPLGEIALGEDIVILSDEIYEKLVYGGHEHVSIASLGKDIYDHTITINGFSKAYAMTGWRVGWMVVPEAYVRDLDKLSQNIYLSAPTPAQLAALVAFEPETLALLDARRDEFRARRDFLLPALRGLGFGVPQLPQGAFYIYANSAALAPDSFVFARELLERAGVAITPGIDFGIHAAREHLRFAYTRPVDKLSEGVDRIARFLRQ